MSTEIDFYILPTQQSNPWLFACRLLNKIYQKKLSTHVHTETKEQAEWFNTYLWSFNDISFIPHHLLEQKTNSEKKNITISDNPEPIQKLKHFDVLLNMSTEIPPFYTHFKRILEIVGSDEQAKSHSRRHYKHYQQNGVTPKIHTIA